MPLILKSFNLKNPSSDNFSDSCNRLLPKRIIQQQGQRRGHQGFHKGPGNKPRDGHGLYQPRICEEGHERFKRGHRGS